MKTTLIIFICLLISVLIYLFILGIKSKTGNAPGLINAQLTPCPRTPNCVNSEFPENSNHYIAPISISAENKLNKPPLPLLINIVEGMGGKIINESHTYLATTFTSPVFRFVDDLEIRIDTKKNLIHFRSASRVGRSDLGTNLKRVKLLKEKYQSRTAS